jgi:hypothetical protein
MGIFQQFKWVVAAAAMVTGVQATGRNLSQGQGAVVDGSKGESVLIALSGDAGAGLELVGAISVNATYTIALHPAAMDASATIFATYHKGNELQRQGEFGDERFGFTNSVERKLLTDADKAAYGLGAFGPSLNGKEGFWLCAEALHSGHGEQIVITPQSRNKLFFYLKELGAHASVSVVQQATG